MNVDFALLRAHEARVGCVHEDVGMPVLGDVSIEESRFEDLREFGSSVLAVWTEILVQLIQALKLDVLGRALVRIARLVRNPHRRPVLVRRLLQQRKQRRRQHNRPVEIHRHVAIHAIIRNLTTHNPPPCVMHEDVQPVRRLLDLLRHRPHGLPVGHVALDPFRAIGLVLSEFLGDGFLGALDDVLGDGEDVQLGDVVREERVGDAVADALAAAGDDGDFAGLVGGVGDVECVRCQVACAAKVFGDCVLVLVS